MTSIDEFTDPSVNGHMVPMVLTPGEMRAEVVSAAWRGVAVEDLDYSFSVATRGESRSATNWIRCADAPHRGRAHERADDGPWRGPACVR